MGFKACLPSPSPASGDPPATARTSCASNQFVPRKISLVLFFQSNERVREGLNSCLVHGRYNSFQQAGNVLSVLKMISHDPSERYVPRVHKYPGNGSQIKQRKYLVMSSSVNLCCLWDAGK